MPKFGKHIILVVAGPTGLVKEHDALVMRANLHPARDTKGKFVTSPDGTPAELLEHLDVVFGVSEVGEDPKTNILDALFRPAFDVPPYKEGARIGWHPADGAAIPIEGTVGMTVPESFLKLLRDPGVAAFIRNPENKIALEQAAAIGESTRRAQSGEQSGQPSAKALDAMAEEQKAVEATSGDAYNELKARADKTVEEHFNSAENSGANEQAPAKGEVATQVAESSGTDEQSAGDKPAE
jgi:hypothetical protein